MIIYILYNISDIQENDKSHESSACHGYRESVVTHSYKADCMLIVRFYRCCKNISNYIVFIKEWSDKVSLIAKLYTHCL